MNISIHRTVYCAAVIGLLACSGGILAAGGDQKTGSADSRFAMEAAQGGMTEVQLGQLAKDKAASDAVKQFGQRMVDDHTKANDKLKSVASQKGITLPTDVGAKNQATIDRLSKLSGAAFDRAYMQNMVSDHKKDVAEFRKEASSGKDPEFKQFASETLPTLETHLKLAQDTARTASSGSADRTKSNDATKH